MCCSSRAVKVIRRRARECTIEKTILIHINIYISQIYIIDACLLINFCGYKLDLYTYICDPFCENLPIHAETTIEIYRISSNSFRGIYSFQVLPAAATKRGRLLNEGGYY